MTNFHFCVHYIFKQFTTAFIITCATGSDGQLPIPVKVTGGWWGPHATQALAGAAVGHAAAGRRCLWREVVQTWRGLGEALRERRGHWPWLTVGLCLCLIFPQQKLRSSQCRTLRQGQEFVQGDWLVAHVGHLLHVAPFSIFLQRLFAQGAKQRHRKPEPTSFSWNNATRLELHLGI